MDVSIRICDRNHQNICSAGTVAVTLSGRLVLSVPLQPTTRNYYCKRQTCTSHDTDDTKIEQCSEVLFETNLMNKLTTNNFLKTFSMHTYKTEL